MVLEVFYFKLNIKLRNYIVRLRYHRPELALRNL